MKCIICGCSAYEVEKLFTFPKQLDRLKIWQENLGMAYRSYMCSHHRICNNHFSLEAFIPQTPSLKLKRDAVPIRQVSLDNQVINNVNFSKQLDSVESAELTEPQCEVPGCGTQVSEGKLFGFSKNKRSARKWINIIRCEKLAKIPIERLYKRKICGKHFTTSSFATPERQKLNRNAVPSLNLPIPSDAFQPLSSPVHEADEFPDDDEFALHDALTVSSEVVIKEKAVDGRCRICLIKSENMIPLDHSTNINGEDSRTLCEILNKCTEVKIAIGDDKPQSLCLSCVEKATIAYEFIIQCEKTERILQEELKCNDEDDSNADYFNDVTNLEKIEANHSHLEGKGIKANEAPSTQEKSTNSTLTTVTSCEEFVCKSSKSISEDSKRKSVINRMKRMLCVYCHRNFSKRVKFKCYTYVLVGKKRYRCVRCGARFTNSRNLNLHIVTHKQILQYKYPKLFLM